MLTVRKPIVKVRAGRHVWRPSRCRESVALRVQARSGRGARSLVRARSRHAIAHCSVLFDRCRDWKVSLRHGWWRACRCRSDATVQDCDDCRAVGDVVMGRLRSQAARCQRLAGFFYSHPVHAAAAAPTGNNQSVSLGYTSVASLLSGCAGRRALSVSLTVGSGLQRVMACNSMKNRVFACLAWPLLNSLRTQPSQA